MFLMSGVPTPDVLMPGDLTPDVLMPGDLTSDVLMPGDLISGGLMSVAGDDAVFWAIKPCSLMES
jgi:hypothetical protein